MGSGFTRLPESERWTYAGWGQLRGVPTDVDAERGRLAAGEPEAAPAAAVPMPSRAEAPPAPKASYVRKADILKYGMTAGCPGCTASARGAGTQAHTLVCRERIIGSVERDEEARVRLF